ncbi:MAG: DUF72 domain-containing protein [Candidatus Bathyarchaeia archaeon]
MERQILPRQIFFRRIFGYYSAKFDTVEVDNTFYRIPTEKAVTKWESQTPSNFSFSFKFPSVITHIKMLKDCERETDLFLERTELLGRKLGAFLLQFPSTFGVDHFSDLADFLQRLPKNRRYVVEVRDERWLNSNFYSLLRANSAALAWVDSPSMSRSREVTSDFLYIRWEGDRSKVNGTLGKIETDKTENLRLWAEKIKPWLSKNIEVYGYFGKYYSGFPPSDINVLLKLLT